MNLNLIKSILGNKTDIHNSVSGLLDNFNRIYYSSENTCPLSPTTNTRKQVQGGTSPVCNNEFNICKAIHNLRSFQMGKTQEEIVKQEVRRYLSSTIKDRLCEISQYIKTMHIIVKQYKPTALDNTKTKDTDVSTLCAMYLLAQNDIEQISNDINNENESKIYEVIHMAICMLTLMNNKEHINSQSKQIREWNLIDCHNSCMQDFTDGLFDNMMFSQSTHKIKLLLTKEYFSFIPIHDLINFMPYKDFISICDISYKSDIISIYNSILKLLNGEDVSGILEFLGDNGSQS